VINSLRARLTLWYVGVLALVLVALCLGAYFAARRMLYQRLDASLVSTLDEAVRVLQQQARNGDPGFAARALETLHYPNRALALLDPGGRLLAEKKSGDRPIRLPEKASGAEDRPRFYELDESSPDADDSCRGVFRQVRSAAGAPYTVVVTQSTESIDNQLDLLIDLSLFVVPFAMILAGAGGWFLARQSLAPMAAMAASTRRITARNLSERLPVTNPKDELGSLATTFNSLLDRLSAAFNQQRQFMADASHELRSPLSVIRTAAEVTLDKAHREEDEYREPLAVVKEQVGRLSRIVDDMFALSRADMGQLQVHVADLYLDEVVDETVSAASVLAARKQIKIESRGPGESPYHGDEGLLRQMILNLLDNAIKYTPQGGHVQVILEQDPAEYSIRVQDTGTGIAPDDQPYIFDRFFRCDKARSGYAGNGAGLGLSIARSIAELHHGQLKLESSGPTGSTFLVSLVRS
jgi:heavy metal sensor kinase